jgi:HD superfamily phosphohydrolase
VLYVDELHGEIELPQIIEDLLPTSAVQHLKKISQDVLPQECLPWPVPSRFEHSLGVACLATIVADNNPYLKDVKNLLLASAILHDAGNSGLSHLNEPFMKHMTGRDGESNLVQRLAGTDTERVLDNYQIPITQVCAFATGQAEPHSIVLNGSLDVDNLDNVCRYWHVANQRKYDPLEKIGDECDQLTIAKSYRFDGTRWYFVDFAGPAVSDWQRLRSEVYRIIYNDPHLVAAQMIWHAVDMAYRRGKLPETYFDLGDLDTLGYLRTCGDDIRYLVDQVEQHRWFESIYSLSTLTPGAKFAKLASNTMVRSEIALRIREEVGLPDSALTCYIGKGRDKRKIEIPFVGFEKEYFDMQESLPIYRVRLYLDPHFACEPAIVQKCNSALESILEL